MQRIIGSILPALALFAPLAWSGAAQAGIGACGDIHVEAEAQCQVEGGIECEAHCTPVAVQAQCAAELQVDCDGMCDLTANVDCNTECTASCMGSCEVDPGQFDCRGECVADCRGGCEGRCGASDSGSECFASCEANCEGHCSAQCDIIAPSADCSGKCEASCSGRCEAEANLDCQIDCQAQGYAGCKVDLEGGCKANCDVEQGALFCDGQWVDHGGNLDECVDSLRAVLDITVEGYAEGECHAGGCSGSAGGSISCAVDPQQSDYGRTAALLGAFGVIAVGFAARRRRR
ncbi:MAG: MYXO-CTERM sorting domain-containing protein [Nannocystaceae bacterium]